jgi:hypothetical protein
MLGPHPLDQWIFFRSHQPVESSTFWQSHNLCTLLDRAVKFHKLGSTRVSRESFSTDPAGLACRFMSASGPESDLHPGVAMKLTQRVPKATFALRKNSAPQEHSCRLIRPVDRPCARLPPVWNGHYACIWYHPLSCSIGSMIWNAAHCATAPR